MSDNKPLEIMSGDYSKDMWEAINTAKTAIKSIGNGVKKAEKILKGKK